jgi:hypothetical protein
MLDYQKRLDDLLGEMPVGATVVVPGRGGWQYDLTKTEKGFDLFDHNPQKWGDGWFAGRTAESPLGMLKIVEEYNKLAVPFERLGVKGVGNAHKDRLIGAVVVDKTGAVTDRFSFSNLINKGIPCEVTSGLEIVVDEKPLGFLRGLFECNRNRIDGHIGIFSPTATEVVVKEMEDLMLGDLLK